MQSLTVFVQVLSICVLIVLTIAILSLIILLIIQMINSIFDGICEIKEKNNERKLLNAKKRK